MTDIEMEQAVISGLLQGKTYIEIGKAIDQGVSSVQKRVTRMVRLYGVSDRYGLEAKLREQAR